MTGPTTLVREGRFTHGNAEPDLVLEPDAVAEEVAFAEADLIAVRFPSSADGRGNSIARRLRLLGYRGRLRATGHVLADQYPLALRCGFDEVEISDELAARMPEEQWAEAMGRVALNYQDRVMGAG